MSNPTTWRVAPNFVNRLFPNPSSLAFIRSQPYGNEIEHRIRSKQETVNWRRRRIGCIPREARLKQQAGEETRDCKAMAMASEFVCVRRENANRRSLGGDGRKNMFWLRCFKLPSLAFLLPKVKGWGGVGSMRLLSGGWMNFIQYPQVSGT